MKKPEPPMVVLYVQECPPTRDDDGYREQRFALSRYIGCEPAPHGGPGAVVRFTHNRGEECVVLARESGEEVEERISRLKDRKVRVSYRRLTSGHGRG